MKYTKSILVTILKSFVVIVLVFTLAACNDNNNDDNDGDQTSTELTTSFTDSLELSTSYQGKSFFNDRIGTAELVSCVDGDTAVFSTDGRNIRVRFQGIDTPESTIKIEPWGKDASKFTCDKLEGASEIVLEGPPHGEDQIDSTGTRYLAWVWYDGRLLNLEVVENAYSTAKGVSGTKYSDIFFDADLKTQKTKRRVWGEQDPKYDYSGSITSLTIAELREDPSAYDGKAIRIGGIITRRIANHAYLEHEGAGIYLYAGYKLTGGLFEVGHEITLTAKTAYYNGSLQLTDIDPYKVDVVSRGNPITPTLVTIPEIEESHEGTLVKLEGLTITDVWNPSATNSYTIETVDSNGNEMDIRVDGNLHPYIERTNFVIGQNIDVVAPVTEFDNNGTEPGNYQLVLSKLDDVTFNDND